MTLATLTREQKVDLAAALEERRRRDDQRRLEAERERLASDLFAIRDRCRSLAEFVKAAWHVVEPNTPLVWNWHLDAMCLHLEAITDGRLTRLLINVPPGSSKSLIVSVLWPAWEWGPKGMRGLRYLTTSFAEDNVKRDTRKHRDLTASEWFRTLWPDVRLVRTGEMSFANADTGSREGSAFGSLTSKRGDRLIIDDPHSTKTAESDVERASTVRQFLEGALNRLNDQLRSAIVVVMQRLHEGDISGVIIARKMGFEHLCLPMEFEIERACRTSLGFVDPRKTDGELLDPQRFPRAAVDDLKQMGAYAYAGQYQQRPTPREGGLFKRHWFEGRTIKQAPAGTVWVRHWDLAASTRSTSARTAGVKMGLMPDGKYLVGHVIKTREEGAEVRRLIKATAQTDGLDVMISLPQDPGQAGKVQKQDMIAMLAGFNARAEPETGDKTTRAEPFSAQCEAGNVYLLEGAWIDDYLDELCLFPAGALKDQVDASSGAFGRLVKPRAATPIFATYGSGRR